MSVKSFLYSKPTIVGGEQDELGLNYFVN